MNFVIDLITVESLWLSSRALDRGIWRSEVQFLIGYSEFFLCPMLATRRKTSFSKTHYVPINNGFTNAIYNIFFTNQGAPGVSVILPTFFQCLPWMLLWRATSFPFFFLEFQWKDTVADKISTFYDVGGIVGN